MTNCYILASVTCECRYSGNILSSPSQFNLDKAEQLFGFCNFLVKGIKGFLVVLPLKNPSFTCLWATCLWFGIETMILLAILINLTNIIYIEPVDLFPVVLNFITLEHAFCHVNDSYNMKHGIAMSLNLSISICKTTSRGNIRRKTTWRGWTYPKPQGIQTSTSYGGGENHTNKISMIKSTVH